jgi:hypothetical protein
MGPQDSSSRATVTVPASANLDPRHQLRITIHTKVTDGAHSAPAHGEPYFTYFAIIVIS